MLALALCCASSVLAEPDSFWLGTGRDGVLTVAAGNTETVNRYAQVVAPLVSGDTDIDVSSTAGFAAGDLALVHQTTGLVPAPASGSASNVDLSSSPVGRWEMVRIASVSANQLQLTAPLQSSYAASVSQVVRVPEYTAVTVASGASLVASPWNGSVGGILAFLVQGSVTNDGTISATGAGFQGGTFVRDPSGSKGCSDVNEPAAQGAQKGEGLGNALGSTSTGRGNVGNAAGGGVCFKSGGGGGSGRGVGGVGGFTHDTLDGPAGPRPVGGMGGATVLFDPYLRLAFGGGGGSGHGSGPEASGQGGARGGGIILIRAQQLLGGGNITSEGGAVPYLSTTDGSGGGGGGGTILARFVGSASCSLVSVAGGEGGYTDGKSGKVGPGGGGGGGYVRVQSSGGTCNVRAFGGFPGSTLVNGSWQDYGAGSGGVGLAEKVAYGLIRPAVPELKQPTPGLATSFTRPAVQATYTGQGTPVLGMFVDGIESGLLSCNSSGLCSGNVARELTEGPHQIVVAVRVDGSWSTPTAPRDFRVDLTPPAPPEVTSPTQGSMTNDQQPLIQGKAEASSSVDIFIDNQLRGTVTADGSGGWSFKPTTLVATGTRSLQVRATDTAANKSALSNPISFTIDVTPPAAPVVLSPTSSSFMNVTRPTIQGRAEMSSKVTVYIDDTNVGRVDANASGDWSLALEAALVEGVHTVKATAQDAAGNVSSASTLTTFTVDLTPPNTTLTLMPVTPTNSTSASFNFESNEAGSSFECRLDTGAFSSCTSPFSVSGLVDGSHSVEVQAKDRAGNVETSPASHTWVVDTQSPAAPVVTSPASGAVVASARPVITGTAELGSTVTIFVDGVSVGTVELSAEGSGWSLTSTELADGSHVVKARARDRAGNSGPESSGITFTVDTTAPNTTLTSAPSGVVTTASATLTFSSEAGATFECSLDGAAFSACSSPLNLNGIVDGSHTFQVRAKDPAGNVDASPASASWVSDTGAPTVSISSGPAAVTNERGATFSFSSNEVGATFECSLDGAAFSACSSPVSFTGLADGAHSFQVRAKDSVGNLSTPASRTWTVDTVAPETSITQKPEAQTQETSAAFAFQSTETGATFECSLDNASYAPCSSPVTYSNLALGNHNLKVRAKDAAGNVDATPESHSWSIDRTSEEEPNTGCACSASGFDPSMSLMALAGLAAFVSRRRRK